MAGTLLGPIDWELTRDEDGIREYTVSHYVETSSVSDGPFIVAQTPGLPVPGSIWFIGNDLDPWVWCRQNLDIQRHSAIQPGEPGRYWVVKQRFSNKPAKRCGEMQFEDPLLEPQKVSGDFVFTTEEGVKDRFGKAILTSSFEPIRGPNNEWEKAGATVTVEQNVPLLQLDLITEIVRNFPLNDSPMWGLPARTVRLRQCSWSKEYYGFCYFYYKRKFQLEIHFDTWDKEVLDEGTKCLRGFWDMRQASPNYKQYVIDDDIINDYMNPRNFIRFKDQNGENARVILNGTGRPFDPGTIITPGSITGTGTGTGVEHGVVTSDTEPGYIFIEYYDECDLLTLLNLPITF